MSQKFLNIVAGKIRQVALSIGLADLPIYTNTSTTTSGTVIFYLTSDKTATGSALFPTTINFMKAEVSDANSGYNYSYAITNSNKTLTVTVKVASGVTLLGISVLAAPVNVANGTSVNILVLGS